MKKLILGLSVAIILNGCSSDQFDISSVLGDTCDEDKTKLNEVYQSDLSQNQEGNGTDEEKEEFSRLRLEQYNDDLAKLLVDCKYVKIY